MHNKVMKNILQSYFTICSSIKVLRYFLKDKVERFKRCDNGNEMKQEYLSSILFVVKGESRKKWINLPNAVLSGLSGGNQKTTKVRQARNTQGNVSM